MARHRFLQLSALSIAAFFFLAVALLASIRPPEPYSPFVRLEVNNQLSLRAVFANQTTFEDCERVLTRARRALLSNCDRCVLEDWGCVSSPGPQIQSVQSGIPLSDYVLNFGGGAIIFKATDALIAKSACELSQQEGNGVCYAPGESRPSLDLPDLNSKFSVDDRRIDFRGSWALLACVAFVSFLASLFIFKTKRLHGALTFDLAQGVQRSHTDPTPRIGGVGIFSGLSVTVLIQLHVFGESALVWIVPLLFASLPAFGFGLAEDLTKSVGVAPRLLATMTSSLLAWWLTGVSLRSLDLAPFDLLLSHTFFSLIFTAFAVGGIANAINIIDGFHGLAAGVSIIILAAIAALAAEVGDVPLAVFASLIAAATAGFLLLNFPRGRVFLGDGGAYLLGFFIGWCGVLLSTRNPDVSAWASLLICAYPVAETLFSITRRLKLRLHIGHPDREHLHSLIHRLIQLRLPGHSLNQTNALVAPPLWIFAAIPIPIALMFSANPVTLSAAFLIFCALYGVLYSWVSARCERALDEKAVS